jgi:tRNA threonylcarbamoyladenosine biosynthesis protein TsaE
VGIDVTLEARTGSVDETRAVSGALAEIAAPGDLFLLVGDLGAGKTAFVQGYSAALGVTAPVTSPTFTLANRYEGRLEINHLDVYRLEDLAETTDLDLDEMFDRGGVTLIEWGDAILPVLPPDYLEVRFTFGSGDDQRILTFKPVGARWQARRRALTEALAPWLSAGGGAC